MFCFHKYSEIKDGYQYCNKCNKAIYIKCMHEWEIITSYELGKRYSYSYSNTTVGLFYVLKCKKMLKNNVKENIYLDNKV